MSLKDMQDEINQDLEQKGKKFSESSYLRIRGKGCFEVKEDYVYSSMKYKNNGLCWRKGGNFPAL